MMNLNLKELSKKNKFNLEKLLKSNRAIIDKLTMPTNGGNIELKKQIINSQIFFEKMKNLFNFYKRKENIDMTTFKSKLPNDAFIKITPMIENMIMNISDNLVNYYI